MHHAGASHDGHSAGELSVADAEVTCRQFVELVTDYFEGTLDVRTSDQVEEHLVMCDWCVAYVEQMRTTTAALRQLSDPVPPEPPDTVLAALRARRNASP